MSFQFSLDLPRDDVALGVVVSTGVTAGPAPLALRDATRACLAARQNELSPELEARRQACRQMLKNGSYKPTGRGKPASEYLLRAASEGAFPSINGLVDANNLVSLEHLLPISLWDLDLAGSDSFVFRLGRAGESYVFNASGQVLDLLDLICGCALREDVPGGEPIVNPIKDSLATKTTIETTRVAAAVYCPLSACDEAHIALVTEELARWVSQGGQGAKAMWAVLLPGSSVTLGE
jgi:DNA/RNA-binding domain of Phe-tRNA-synthetase-like protein